MFYCSVLVSRVKHWTSELIVLNLPSCFLHQLDVRPRRVRYWLNIMESTCVHTSGELSIELDGYPYLIQHELYVETGVAF